ncbi:hypothetical protein Tco_1025664, partial [Tanacetum coccineum]
DENAKVDNVEEKQGDHKDEIGEDEFWNTHFTNHSVKRWRIKQKKKIAKRKSTKEMTPPSFSLGLSPDTNKKEMEPSGIICKTLAPTLKIKSNAIDTYCLVLNHEQGVNNKRKKTKHFFHTGMITKDMFNWNMKDEKKYDEVKQYKAFSDTMKNEFKKDDEVKKLKDLEMKNMFSVHLKEAQHPRAKDVLNKKPTILRPKWGTEENNTYSLYMLIVSIYLCITIVVTLFCAYAACMHLITPRWEKDE